jgi:hypothetical protein
VLAPPPQPPQQLSNGLPSSGTGAGAGFGTNGGVWGAQLRTAGDQRHLPVSPRSPHSFESRSPLSLERALRRNKLARVYRGKSSRRWAVMESLHLAVVKSYLKSQRRHRIRHHGGHHNGHTGNGHNGSGWPPGARPGVQQRHRSMTPEG